MWYLFPFHRCASDSASPLLHCNLQSFECLKQLTIFGASEERSTQRCLAALQKAMPWLLLDV